LQSKQRNNIEYPAKKIIQIRDAQNDLKKCRAKKIAGHKAKTADYPAKQRTKTAKKNCLMDAAKI